MSKLYFTQQAGTGAVGNANPGASSPVQQPDDLTRKGEALIEQFFKRNEAGQVGQYTSEQSFNLPTEQFGKVLEAYSHDHQLSADQQTLLQTIQSNLPLIAALDGDGANVSGIDFAIAAVGDGNGNSLVPGDIENLKKLDQMGISVAAPSEAETDLLAKGQLVELAKQGKLTDTTYAALDNMDAGVIQQNLATVAAQWNQLSPQQQETLGNLFGDLGIANRQGQSTGVVEQIQQHPQDPFSSVLKQKLKERWKITGETGKSQSFYRKDPLYTDEALAMETFFDGKPVQFPIKKAINKEDEAFKALVTTPETRTKAGKNAAFAFLEAEKAGKTESTPLSYGERLDATRPKINTDAYLSVFDADHDGLLNENEFGKAFGISDQWLLKQVMKAADTVDGQVNRQGNSLNISYKDAEPLLGFFDAGGFKGGQLDATVTPDERKTATARLQELTQANQPKDLISGLKHLFRKLIGKPAPGNTLINILKQSAKLYKVE